MELVDFASLSDGLIYDLYKWRNSDIVRVNSFNKSEISLDEHKNFIKSLKGNDEKKYFLVFVDDEAVGVVSFTDINNKSANIGYYKNPYTEKRGIGKLLINKAVEFAVQSLSLDTLIMKVYKHNKISINCIRHCGFVENKTDDDVIEYVLKLSK